MERLIFMGTPRFAVPALEALIGKYEIATVVTQPDRRRGRGRKPTPPPVKKVALAHDLPILQPESLRQPEAVARLEELKPEVIVVVAFGQILPPKVLAIPPKGCVNVHASLLPKYRGSAPVAAAILAGDEETGVSVMLIDEGLDRGPILAQTSCSISPLDTRASLSDKLARLGADLLVETLPRWLEGEIEPQPQDESKASYAPHLKKEDGLIDWFLSAIELWRRVRAYYPWPSTYTHWQGRTLKVLKVEPLTEWRGKEEPGRVLQLEEGLAVATGEGALLLEEVQLAGRQAMPASDFARGQRDFIGAKLRKM